VRTTRSPGKSMNPQPAGLVSIHLLLRTVVLTTAEELAIWLFRRGLLDCREASPEHTPVKPPALCWWRLANSLRTITSSIFTFSSVVAIVKAGSTQLCPRNCCALCHSVRLEGRDVRCIVELSETLVDLLALDSLLHLPHVLAEAF
jgi:hypothetical protein